MENITVRVGDLFASGAQTLVNTVNTVGIMGKGIARGFRERFPRMFQDYAARCSRGEVKLGEPYLYRQLVGPWILNFPTKGHWRAVSKLSDIVTGLEYLVDYYKEWGITSIAVPPLGCGNGQLDWNVVGPTLYRYLTELEIPVELYAPLGTPAEQLTEKFLTRPNSAATSGEPLQLIGARLPAGQVAIVAVLSRIVREPYHWPVGRVIFQKIAYFLTVSGIPTGLHYERSSFGPFAKELKPVIARLENHGVLREERHGNMFWIEIGPTYSDARNLYIDRLREWREPIERVADLFLRVPRTGDAEIAATVHFVARDLKRQISALPTEQMVLQEVLQWKARRKPPLRPPEVAETIRNLALLDWIKVKPSLELPVEEDELRYA
jgi:O-acetyl-ADP-ribose deacetylase (regulator of RNase III)